MIHESPDPEQFKNSQPYMKLGYSRSLDGKSFISTGL